MKLRQRIAQWIWKAPQPPAPRFFTLTDMYGPRSKAEWEREVVLAEPIASGNTIAATIAAEFLKHNYPPPTTVYIFQGLGDLGVLAVLLERHDDDRKIMAAAIERSRPAGTWPRMCELLYIEDMQPRRESAVSGLSGELGIRLIRKDVNSG